MVEAIVSSLIGMAVGILCGYLLCFAQYHKKFLDALREKERAQKALEMGRRLMAKREAELMLFTSKKEAANERAI